MNYIIFDLECTCWKEMHPLLVQEIIEIGAYHLNDFGEIEGKFSRFVKPILNPMLSPFCKELTTITQEQVNRAKTYPEVIEEFQDWIAVDDEEYILCSWGNYDRKMLVTDCILHRLDFEWTNKHANLKQKYQDLRKLRQPIGLMAALNKEGMEFSGTLHRGIDDAMNLARIFVKYIDSWSL